MNTNVNNNESGNMEVMNQVIVRLNEIKSVKLMNVSKPKRPAAKFNKEVAKYLLSNWDNLEQLKTCQLQMRSDMPNATCTEVMDMYDARVAELQAALEKENEPEKSVAEDTDEPEPEVAEPEASESQDVESETVETEVADDTTTSEETQVEDDNHNSDETEVSETAETETVGIDETTKSYESSKKQQAKKKSDKTKKRPGAPKTLKVGDRHKNGKWLWTEYEPGKFDWRTDPAIKAKNAAKSSVSKSTTDAGKAKPKAQKNDKASSKTKKVTEHKKTPAITIDEMLSRHAPSGLSKAQKNVLGLLKKGYRMTMIGTGVFLQKDDDRKSIELTTVKALIERYKLDAEPTGLWIK